MAQDFNPSTQEAGVVSWGQPGEFQVRQGYIVRPYLATNTDTSRINNNKVGLYWLMFIVNLTRFKMTYELGQVHNTGNVCEIVSTRD